MLVATAFDKCFYCSVFPSSKLIELKTKKKRIKNKIIIIKNEMHKNIVEIFLWHHTVHLYYSHYSIFKCF